MDLSTELRRLLPREAVIADPASLSVYECDALSAYRQPPKVVVLPRTAEEVRAILRLCHRLRVPVVARGAGTGLSGGALPHAEGVLLSLTRLNRILSIDPANRTATVEPGVRNIQIACTIGGNVAENSGGVHCLKYGLTLNNLLALTVMTIEGERLELGSQTLDAPGYDLLALMTGSEGLLGIVTSVTVELLPRPQAAQVLLAAFKRVEDAGNGVAAVIAAGIIPAGLEMMDRLAIEAAEDFVHAGYPLDAEAILLCEIDGHPAEIEAELPRVAEVLKAQGATEVRVARDESERQRFWTGRKAAFPALGRIAPDYYCMDGTIPRRHLGAVLARIGALSQEFGLAVANVFHAGDGNLHPLILYDANAPGQLERAEAFGGKILEVCVEAGGTITGEHGVGVEKLNQMCVQFTAEELEQFHAVKRAFDPDGLLNPGKAIPTLRRCAEFGALHVHAGKLPFPELERF
ncbi:MAG: putative FAD-linked oxidoreductase [Chromatiales bacterium USCg_Taylor]|nr:MAG: putative FAD-linked oxidoreductase [Chromatiales bacterium USCg_Taylor]